MAEKNDRIALIDKVQFGDHGAPSIVIPPPVPDQLPRLVAHPETPRCVWGSSQRGGEQRTASSRAEPRERFCRTATEGAATTSWQRARGEGCG